MMKKVMLALVAVAMLGAFTASAEAGGRYRRAVRRSYFPPVVVRPRYVAPVVVARPVYVAPRVYVPRPAYSYYGPPRVYGRTGNYYYGRGVRVRTPGFGLSISY